MHASPCADDCQKKLKCVSCGGEHMATSRSCPVWQREEIVSVKYRKDFSFQDARKIVNSRTVLSGSYAMAAKGKQVKATELKDAQTQTDIAVQTETTTAPPKGNSYKSSGKPVQPLVRRVLLKTIIKQIHLLKRCSQIAFLRDVTTPFNSINRFQCLDEDMEAESIPAESTNKQGRIIKLNKK